MLGAFFDDSGTHSTSPVVAIGGLLGTEVQWDVFAQAWTNKLRAPVPGKPKLSQFHLSPCRAGKGEFRDYSRVERDHLTKEFRQIILETGLVTIAAAVNRAAWNELVTPDIADQLGAPEELAFYKCVETIIKIIRLRKPGEQIAMCFDEGTRPKLQWWTRAFMIQKQQYPELASMFFAPVSKVVPLQGADMIATETYQFAQAWIKDGPDAIANPHFEDFRYRDLSAGLIFDREQIAEVVARLRQKVRELSSLHHEDGYRLVFLTMSDASFNDHRDQIAELAARNAIPGIAQAREYVEAGGLMSYGSNQAEALRLLGGYAARILKGEKPVDLPVQQATKIELAINTKTAKSLGLSFPITLLARADEAIE